MQHGRLATLQLAALTMGKYIKSKDFGISRPPSAYALFTQSQVKAGVRLPLRNRLCKKTPVAHKSAIIAKWHRLSDAEKSVFEASAAERAADCRLARSLALKSDVTQDAAVASLSGAKPYIPACVHGASKSSSNEQPPSQTFSTTDGITFTVGEMLGHGTYGQVFAASDNLGHKFAVKQALKDDVLRDLAMEFRLLQAMQSPFVVRAYSLVTVNASLAVVLEVADGSVLAWVKNTRFSICPPTPLTLWRIAGQATQGLSHMHSHNVLHLDVKPGNMLVFHKGDIITVKISDLGISKQMIEDEVVVEGDMAFSCGYRPPEAVMAGKKEAGVLSKIKLLLPRYVSLF